MDFGLFFLFGLQVLVFLAALTIFVLAAVTRHRLWRPALAVTGVSAVLVLVLGLAIYKVYSLDEGLYFAAREGDLARMKTLLRRGAGTGYRWENGESTLDAARQSGCPECVKLLEKAGAR